MTQKFWYVAHGKSGLGRTDQLVQVHCYMGMSRSVCIVCGYLIAEKGMTVRQAIQFVKERRGIAKPNAGFVQQLDAWAKQCHGKREGHGILDFIRSTRSKSSPAKTTEGTKA